ncbi:hypothetical protein OnM2_00200 [Erysiphe neolycopersici]|uniref:Secreted protein n=1 Tax=Erysiphe neolycopersici TaxID=212602 RepID=A0A420HZK5_9PEZI|nr:hypothetical protein OnM2_00200 [Erysiphe neolycopersici]
MQLFLCFLLTIFILRVKTWRADSTIFKAHASTVRDYIIVKNCLQFGQDQQHLLKDRRTPRLYADFKYPLLSVTKL